MTKTTKPKYPYLGINGEYLDKTFLDQVWEYLDRLSFAWDAGISEPSPTDKFAYHVLKQITIGGSKVDDTPPCRRQ